MLCSSSPYFTWWSQSASILMSEFRMHQREAMKCFLQIKSWNSSVKSGKDHELQLLRAMVRTNIYAQNHGVKSNLCSFCHCISNVNIMTTVDDSGLVNMEHAQDYRIQYCGWGEGGLGIYSPMEKGELAYICLFSEIFRLAYHSPEVLDFLVTK